MGTNKATGKSVFSNRDFTFQTLLPPSLPLSASLPSVGILQILLEAVTLFHHDTEHLVPTVPPIACLHPPRATQQEAKAAALNLVVKCFLAPD